MSKPDRHICCGREFDAHRQWSAGAPGISIAIEIPKDRKFLFAFAKRLASTSSSISELAKELHEAGVALRLSNLALWSILFVTCF